MDAGRSVLNVSNEKQPTAQPPISCKLCEYGCSSQEEFEQHVQDCHGGLQRYRHNVIYLLSTCPQVLNASDGRSMVANIAEFQAKGAMDWKHFTPAMKKAMLDS